MNNKYKILVVDDDDAVCSAVSSLLESNGMMAIRAKSGSLAQAMFASFMPDAVILDPCLPDTDGSEVLLGIRKSSAVPVIILSARTDEAEKVRLLDSGANDYVTKPYGAAELLARVRVALRNCRHSSPSGRLPGGRFVSGGLEIDYDARRVFFSGSEISLTQNEYNIVALLSEHCGKLLTYSDIVSAVWGSTDGGSKKKLQVNMSNILRKLGTKPGGSPFTNEAGVGYRLD